MPVAIRSPLRPLRAACLLAAFACGGCANVMTTRTIESFSEGLAATDLEQLRASASPRFEHHALRLPQAGEDLDTLNLPTGETSVVQVENVSDELQHVTVQITAEDGEQRTLEYHLTREAETGDWLVDDVYFTQNLRGHDGPVTKSVAEQMDLLLSVRETVDVWRHGDREQLLDACTDELRGVLSELPPAHLHQLTQQYLDGVGSRSLQPEVRIEDDLALVLLPAGRGKLMIRLEREGDRWRTADLSMEAVRDEEPLSLHTAALALRTASRFLEAYQRGDRTELSRLATDPFFENALVAADLTSLTLPVVQIMAAPYELHRHGSQMEVVLSTDAASYMLSLRDGGSPDRRLEGPTAGAAYQVDEVTIYDNDAAQARRLSAVFTAQAVAEVFAEALIRRDRPALMALSTSDFRDRVWSRLDETVFRALPLDEIEAAPPRVAATAFNGPVAEITVTQGSRALTYVLRSAQGRMYVDDVQLPVDGRPTSLKANLEVLTPLYGFAYGVHAGDLDELRRYSGSGLNRKVWSQTTSVPDTGFALADHLTLPVRAIRIDGPQAVVQLTDGIRDTEVTLIRERGPFVVQDVHLRTGDGPGQQITLLNALRSHIAERTTETGVLPASYEQPAAPLSEPLR